MQELLDLFTLPNVIFNITFALISAAFGVVLSKGSSDSSNSTPIVVITEQINVKKKNISYEYDNRQASNSKDASEDNELAISMLVGAGICAVLYARYHETIIAFFIVMTICILLGALAYVTTRFILDTLDGLTKYWFIVTLIVVIFNIVSLILMSNQDITMTEGLKDIGRILYYFIGALFSTAVNMAIVAIYMYMMSFSMFLNWPNRFTYKVMKLFDNIFGNRKGVTVIFAVLIAFSLLFSSGILFSMVEDLSSGTLEVNILK